MAAKAEPKLKEHSAQFREKATHLGRDVQELGRITRDIANDTMGVLKENAGEYYDQGIEKAKSMEQNLESRIRDNPLQALLIAVGLGFLVGMIFRRR